MDLIFSTLSTVSGFLGTASSHTQSAVSSLKWPELPTDAQRFFSRVATSSTNFISLRWADLPPKTKEWIREHPTQTAFYVAHGIVIVAPTPVTAPLIGAAGLATAGPAAGSAAAAIQTALTSIGTNSVALSTAVSTGHGAPAIADGLQAALAIGTGLYGLWSYFSGPSAEDASKKPAVAVEEVPAKDGKKQKQGIFRRSATVQEPVAPKRALSFKGLFGGRRSKTEAA